MNERIEHITKQVDEYFDDLTIEFSREAWQAKFAELIVRECMDVVQDINQEQDGGSTVVNAADEIKQYFGVEK